MDEHGLQPLPQPLWILGSPSFLDLTPEWQESVWDDKRLAFLLPSFKGLLKPSVWRRKVTTGPTPSPVALSISGSITWEGLRANWRLQRILGRDSPVCSLYKTKPEVKLHTQQPPQSINHRTPKTLKQILLHKLSGVNNTGSPRGVEKRGGSGGNYHIAKL